MARAERNPNYLNQKQSGLVKSTKKTILIQQWKQ